MGKQIYYWIGYEDFLKIAQVVLDNNCVILKMENGKLEIGNSLDFITKSINRYYFLPLDLNIDLNNGLDLFKLRQQCKVIEAGYSAILHEKKEIIRNRIYVGTGYYDKGEYIYRDDSLTRNYNKLVRIVKKIAPFTELTDKIMSLKKDDYLQTVEYKHKEYVSNECLKLRELDNYKLTT